MTIPEQLKEVKNKFKKLHWQQDKDKFNAIMIDRHVFIREPIDELDSDDLIDIEVVEGDFFLKIFLFDMNDAKDLPTEMDGVEIQYVSTFPKKQSAT